MDDHLLVRQGLKQVLCYEYRDALFGEAATAAEALVQIKARPWRLVVLDVSLPGDDGFSVLREISARYPETPVLMLSMHADSHYAVRSQQLGAAGYLSKSSGRIKILHAVRDVLNGKKHFDGLISRSVDLDQPALSARELKVLTALAGGRRTGEIAAALNLSGKTVSTYKRRVLNKLGLHSTADLVRYAIDHKLF